MTEQDHNLSYIKEVGRTLRLIFEIVISHPKNPLRISGAPELHEWLLLAYRNSAASPLRSRLLQQLRMSQPRLF